MYNLLYGKVIKRFFLELWLERPHFSEVSGKYLGEIPYTYYFSHILSKGSSPELKYNKENIVFMTLEEHQLWEFGDPSKLIGEGWEKIKALKQKLKEKIS